MWGVRHPLQAGDLGQKREKADRVAVRVPAGVRHEILSQLPHAGRGEAAQSHPDALNEFAQADTEVKADLLEFTALAWSGGESDGTSLIALRQKLKDITAQQALLLDQVLGNMDDSDLTAQLKALMDEKQAVQEQIQAMEQAAVHNENQASRMAELKEWMAKLEVNAEYHDEQVRLAIEKITVLDAETIRIKFKYPGLEMDKKLN